VGIQIQIKTQNKSKIDFAFTANSKINRKLNILLDTRFRGTATNGAMARFLHFLKTA
jgi:hypothetical protein